MKTTILIFISVCSLCILSSYGQPEKGTYMLGGSASTGYSITSGDNAFNISLAPNLGYFFSENLAIGASLPLSLYILKDYTNLNYGFAPFFRYYFGQSSAIMYFVTGSFGISGYSQKYDDTSSSSSSITGRAGFGGTYFLNESIGLEAIFGYTYNKWKESDATSNIGLSLGFQIYFGK
jgi:quinol-cytochrome oxidoreductase complex cytochrome b subunit